MARVNTSDSSSIVEINVVPLVDIVLVILIIFMVAAPLVMQPKIDINLPKASAAADDKDKAPFRVVVGKAGELYLNNQPITLDGVRDESKRVASINADTAALLIADKGATLEMVTDLVEAIKGGGIKKVAFSVQKK